MKYYFFILLILSGNWVKAQELDSLNDNHIFEQQIEALSENSLANQDYSQIAENLNFLKTNPINLNSTNAEESNKQSLKIHKQKWRNVLDI